MGSYSVVYRLSAERELRGIPGNDILRIARRIEALGENPRPPGVMKLSGADGYRIRQGDWRVVYLVDDAARRVDVMKIGNRREVYR